jgi:ECF sigma factor
VLVNEAYLRLIDQTRVRWQNRAQFFGIAAQLMRRILVDYARNRGYLKRGGGVQNLSLEEVAVVSPERSAEVVAVDDALNGLASLDPRKSKSSSSVSLEVSASKRWQRFSKYRRAPSCGNGRWQKPGCIARLVESQAVRSEGIFLSLTLPGMNGVLTGQGGCHDPSPMETGRPAFPRGAGVSS